MTDAIQQAITDAITEPQSTTIEGEAVTNRNASDLLALEGRVKSNDALNNIASGNYSPFVRVLGRPPGAGGDCP